jgi:putative ATPase
MDTIAHRAAGSGRIFVVQGDLTQQPVDAIVNAANEHLAHAGGVAAAIVRTGGQVIQEESDQWVRDNGPVAVGRAAVTTGGALQASHVIHVVGPRYREGQENSALLEEAVQAALDAAEGNSLRSVAMPAISAGIFGYPRLEAAGVIAGSVTRWFESHPESRLKEVRLVGYDQSAALDFATALEAS